MIRSIRRSGEAGQAVVMVALMMVTLLVAAGFAVDAGLLYLERQRQQVAADAAADAAAVTMLSYWAEPDRAVRARTTALDYAARNGYSLTSVTVNTPPLSGRYLGNADFVEVIIARAMPTSFVRLLGPQFATQNVRSRAVGGILEPNSPYALMALSPDASPAVTISNDSFIELDYAGAAINSDAANALYMTGYSEFRVDDAVPSQARIDVTGRVSRGVNTVIEPRPPRVDRPVQRDPLAYLRSPDGAGLPHRGAIVQSSGVRDLPPGIYDSIAISGSGQVRLGTGHYIIRGGGITISGGGRLTHISGQGPFIYNGCSNFPLAGGTCAGITVLDDGAIRLERRLPDGYYRDISIWQPCENRSTFRMASRTGRTADADIEIVGAVYMPCADVVLEGDSDLRIYDGLIYANTFRLTGDSQIDLDWGSRSIRGLRVARLVE